MSSTPHISRRTAVKLSVCALCSSVAACRDSSGVVGLPPTLPDDVATIRGSRIDVQLSRVPQFTAVADADVAVIFPAAQLIVIKRSVGDFRAFSAVCPHAGCGVSVVRSARLECPCHGSAFAFDGARIEGPAPTGLMPLSSTLDQSSNILTVTRPVG